MTEALRGGSAGDLPGPGDLASRPRWRRFSAPASASGSRSSTAACRTASGSTSGRASAAARRTWSSAPAAPSSRRRRSRASSSWMKSTIPLTSRTAIRATVTRAVAAQRAALAGCPAHPGERDARRGDVLPRQQGAARRLDLPRRIPAGRCRRCAWSICARSSAAAARRSSRRGCARRSGAARAGRAGHPVREPARLQRLHPLPGLRLRAPLPPMQRLADLSR